MNDSSAHNQASKLADVSEEDLARRVQEGCASSFSELAQRLQPRLLFVLRRRLGHYADAEDVTQKTLLRAFEKIHLYNPKQKFSPWLFTIALRLATDHHRKKQLPTTAGEPAYSVIDSQPNPMQQAIEQETSQDLWSMAEKILKPDQWTALWLSYGEGQTVKEIAKSLNRTTVSVRVLLHRARKALVPHLAKFAELESFEATDRSAADCAAASTLQFARAEL